MANPEYLERLRQGVDVSGMIRRAKNLPDDLDYNIPLEIGAAILIKADLSGASFNEANLSRANLSEALLVKTHFLDAILTDCRIYGISAWEVKLSKATKQEGLIITPKNEPAVTVDDLKVAQFVYLLLRNENIRNVIDTVGRRGVLLLGRFTESRIAALERLREELRKRDYLPIVFNFDKPETKDSTETVRQLAGLSKFVIADITNPTSSPLERQTTLPDHSPIPADSSSRERSPSPRCRTCGSSTGIVYSNSSNMPRLIGWSRRWKLNSSGLPRRGSTNL